MTLILRGVKSLSKVIFQGVAVTRNGRLLVFHRPEDTADLSKAVVVATNILMIPGVEATLKALLLGYTNKAIRQGTGTGITDRSLAELRRHLGISQGEGFGGQRPPPKLKYQWIKLDIPVAQMAEGAHCPEGVLGLLPIRQQWWGREKRFYLAAARPYLLVIVLRHGIGFASLVPGVFLRCVVGWHDGQYGFVPDDQRAYTHSKLSVDQVVALPLDTVEGHPEFVPMTGFLERVPRMDETR